MSVRVFTCSTCGRKTRAGKRGPVREHCRECDPLVDAIRRLEQHLPSVAGRATDDAIIELHHRLYCLLADDLPRPRRPDGTFKSRRER